MEPDFTGYATKAGLKCADGRTITAEAFKHMDGMTVPLVWQHGGMRSPENVLGHAKLEHRGDGMYTYAYFNDTPSGRQTKALVQHGDINQMSIFANSLVEKAKTVLHGAIVEVSLVLKGANPGALIDPISIRHSDGDVEELDDEAIIYTGLDIEHAATTDEKTDDKSEEKADDADDSEMLQEIYDSMSDEQKDVVAHLVGAALARNNKSDDTDDSDQGSGESAEHGDANTDEDSLEHQEGPEMTRNVFEQNSSTDTQVGGTLTHDQITTILEEGKKNGSFREALLAHAEDYGITTPELLFPDAKAIDSRPEWITRKMEWVESVLNGARKLPFSKIKSLHADLTHEEARAKGYIKANLKKEQFFALTKRETGPKTVYKKQKMDRDDIVDMTEFDVVAWLWVEMRFMLREEIARAVLIGDGREVDDPDKIDEDKIRPIAKDDEFYTDVVPVAASTNASALIEAVLRARPSFKGSGLPTAFMTEDVLTDMLLLKDKMGRRLYNTEAELASALRARDIVSVPVMEGATTETGELLMVLVNMADYSIGSTRGGEVTTFEDFDIDFNQHKYLIEGRLSGALTKHKTAQIFVRAGGTSVTPDAPTFVASTGVVTIPSVTGVVYSQDGVVVESGAQAAIDPGETTEVTAETEAGYYFPPNTDTDWEFTRDA